MTQQSEKLHLAVQVELVEARAGLTTARIEYQEATKLVERCMYPPTRGLPPRPNGLGPARVRLGKLKANMAIAEERLKAAKLLCRTQESLAGRDGLNPNELDDLLDYVITNAPAEWRQDFCGVLERTAARYRK